MLRYAIAPRFEDLHVSFITSDLQPIRNLPNRAQIITQRHVRHVFHQNRSWFHFLDHSKKNSPQFSSRVDRVTNASLNKITNL